MTNQTIIVGDHTVVVVVVRDAGGGALLLGDYLAVDANVPEDLWPSIAAGLIAACTK